MDKSKARLERVRPILLAMERSIDAARQRRTADDDPAPAGSATAPVEAADGPRPSAAPTVKPAAPPVGGGPVDPETATRMRARPKRPRGFDETPGAR